MLPKKNTTLSLEKLFLGLPTLEAKKGQIIIRAGDKIDNVYFIKKGLVRVFALSEEGEEMTIHFFEKGSVWPMMIVLSGLTNKFNYEVRSDSRLIKIPAKKVISILKSNPEIFFNLTVGLATALVKLMSRLESHTFDSAYERIAGFILYLATKSGVKKGKEVAIPFSLTHQDIASWVGVNRETVSRRMVRFVEKGVIEYRNSMILIKDLKKLKTASLKPQT